MTVRVEFTVQFVMGKLERFSLPLPGFPKVQIWIFPRRPVVVGDVAPVQLLQAVPHAEVSWSSKRKIRNQRECRPVLVLRRNTIDATARSNASMPVKIAK